MKEDIEVDTLQELEETTILDKLEFTLAALESRKPGEWLPGSEQVYVSTFTEEETYKIKDKFFKILEEL